MVSDKDKEEVMKNVKKFYNCYEIGRVKRGSKKLVFKNRINWI